VCLLCTAFCTETVRGCYPALNHASKPRGAPLVSSVGQVFYVPLGRPREKANRRAGPGGRRGGFWQGCFPGSRAPDGAAGLDVRLDLHRTASSQVGVKGIHGGLLSRAPHHAAGLDFRLDLHRETSQENGAPGATAGPGSRAPHGAAGLHVRLDLHLSASQKKGSQGVTPGPDSRAPQGVAGLDVGLDLHDGTSNWIEFGRNEGTAVGVRCPTPCCRPSRSS
jgi:hypothetical protein